MITPASFGSDSSQCSSQPLQHLVAQTQIVGFSPSITHSSTITLVPPSQPTDQSLIHSSDFDAVSHSSHVSWISIGINRHVRFNSSTSSLGSSDSEQASDAIHTPYTALQSTTSTRSKRRPRTVFPSAIPSLALDTASTSDTTDSDLDSEADVCDASGFTGEHQNAVLATVCGLHQVNTFSKPIDVRLTLSQQRHLSVHTAQRRVVCAHLNAEFTRPRTISIEGALFCLSRPNDA
ncbi:hypothetical protein BDEG_22303 [Batrachochytrium dendrobatidis JEL423]|uniref:Uncharacterized protein n=1 Tax=Batrachochytrium dendrobatidis (strain JEL423) TaxID=403673 RepID=A0A177WE27_BATDL|nr:hypothetical protein BDEG_22296 [Batrachochytrium dendrobatidis JEL423]OAJ38359.1 hypothetical protein BDEG_22303 [Batrachochytrium dendrobatidis JEL423]